MLMADSKAHDTAVLAETEREVGFQVAPGRRYMNASHDRPGHPNIDARVFLLGQVSDAAAALAGTRVPEQLNGTTATTRISFEPAADAKFKSLSARPDDSFNPDIPRVTSHIRSSLKFAKVGGSLIILALTAGLVAGQSRVNAIWQKMVTDSSDVVQVASSSALGAIRRAQPRLIVQQSRAAMGEPVPLGLTLQGTVDGAVVHIEGLARGMELSAGRAVGFDGWEVPASDLGNTWIAPPDGFTGSVDLVAELRGSDGEVADRQTITLGWVSAIAPIPVPRELTESTTPASISEAVAEIWTGR
jgi:hypothetical protein